LGGRQGNNYGVGVVISAFIIAEYPNIISSYSYIGTKYLGTNLGTHINLKN
jgi:hypothetical protein